jgi:insulysin
LIDSSAVSSSPLIKFGTGNLETLQHESTRSDLIKFHTDNYSANLMKVCIITHAPLDEITPYIVDLFEAIPNNNNARPSYPEKPFPNDNFCALWKYVPIKNTNSVSVIYVLLL